MTTTDVRRAQWAMIAELRSLRCKLMNPPVVAEPMSDWAIQWMQRYAKEFTISEAANILSANRLTIKQRAERMGIKFKRTRSIPKKEVAI